MDRRCHAANAGQSTAQRAHRTRGYVGGETAPGSATTFLESEGASASAAAAAMSELRGRGCARPRCPGLRPTTILPLCFTQASWQTRLGVKVGARITLMKPGRGPAAVRV